MPTNSLRSVIIKHNESISKLFDIASYIYIKSAYIISNTCDLNNSITSKDNRLKDNM